MFFLSGFASISWSQGESLKEAPPNPAPQVPMTLDLFRPKSRLTVQEHLLESAAYPVIDIHTHFLIRMKHDREGLERFVSVMDRNQIAVCCSLDGTLGSRLDDHIDYLWKDYRDRFVIFANIDFQGSAPADKPALWDCNQPDFARKTVEQLREAHRRGVSGLKVFKQLGLHYRLADGTLLPIDHPMLDPIWKECGELGLPVIMHTADPSAFFEPIDANNERYEELSRHPDWAFPKDRFPRRDELHAARNRVFARHPKTQFIAAHLGNDGENLAQTAKLLDDYPNLHVEIASRISELGRQPFTAKAFLEEYGSRILFGTDGPWPETRLRLYWRFLETHDEYFPYSEKEPPPQGLWNIFGVQLEPPVLRKIYHENASRLIPGVAERLEKWNQKNPTKLERDGR